MDVLTASAVPAVVRGARALRFWSVASLVANIGIVITGGVVRLTSSGMGCPTWPRCTEDSYVSHPELGLHGAIEFGNRLLTFVLVAVALLTVLAAVRFRDENGPRRDLRWLAIGLALGIPAQAVIGGISVWTHLNPYVVALHFLASMVLIALAVWLVRKSWRIPVRSVGRPGRVLSRVTFWAMWVAVWLGTVVTGSGPHAGDQFAVRNGLDPVLLSHIHAAAVWVTIGATLGCVWLLRSRAALGLLAVEIVQAAIGLTQYHLGLPVGLVALHLLGAALAIAAATNLMLSVARD
jgi:heme a synthase